MQPNFLRDAYEGQMTVQERAIIYNCVVEMKPQTCFEIGTWNGGGSTYFISAGLETNQKGVLHTIEIDERFYAHAVALYTGELSALYPFIKFHFGDSLKVYPGVLNNIDKIDLLLLDGKEDSKQTLREYLMFLPFMKKDSVLFCHDWNTEKMLLLKEWMKDEKRWDCLKIIDSVTGLGIFYHV